MYISSFSELLELPIIIAVLMCTCHLLMKPLGNYKARKYTTISYLKAQHRLETILHIYIFFCPHTVMSSYHEESYFCDTGPLKVVAKTKIHLFPKP
jgi:hypothetical protein